MPDIPSLLRSVAALLYPQGDTRRAPIPDPRALGRLRTDLWQLAESLDDDRCICETEAYCHECAPTKEAAGMSGLFFLTALDRGLQSRLLSLVRAAPLVSGVLT